jgi:hypothetical protein
LHFFEGFAGKAGLFARGLELFEFGGAFDLVGEVALAFEAAGGEAGEGVEHAQEINRVEFDGIAEGIGAEFSDGLADETGGGFVSGLERIDRLVFTGEIEDEFVTEAGLGNQALLTEVVVIAAVSPGIDGIEGEISAELGEGGADFLTGAAVIEHFVDALTEFFGKASDFAVAGSLTGDC